MKTIEDNKALRDKISTLSLPVSEYVKIPFDDEEGECECFFLRHFHYTNEDKFDHPFLSVFLSDE